MEKLACLLGFQKSHVMRKKSTDFGRGERLPTFSALPPPPEFPFYLLTYLLKRAAKEPSHNMRKESLMETEVEKEETRPKKITPLPPDFNFSSLAPL